MFPFESVAYAQAGGAEANPFVSFVPLILIVVVFWFFLIRPPTKEAEGTPEDDQRTRQR